MTTPAALPPTFPPDGEIDRELAELTLGFVIDEGRRRHYQALWIEGRVIIAERNPGVRGAELARLLAENFDVCGTRGCYAGWASLFAGWRQVGREDTVENPATGERTTMRRAARRSLGLTHVQAAVLFDATNSRAELEEMVARLLRDPADVLRDYWEGRDIDPDLVAEEEADEHAQVSAT
jgi:hypothetical protein